MPRESCGWASRPVGAGLEWLVIDSLSARIKKKKKMREGSSVLVTCRNPHKTEQHCSQWVQSG